MSGVNDLTDNAKMCLKLLKWYRKNLYLNEAASELGERYRKFGQSVNEIVSRMDNTDRRIWEYCYSQNITDREARPQVGLSHSRFSDRKHLFVQRLTNSATTEQLKEWGRLLNARNQ